MTKELQLSMLKLSTTEYATQQAEARVADAWAYASMHLVRTSAFSACN